MRHAPAMARSATLYRIHLEVSLIDRALYAEKTTTVAQHPSETLERTLARVLAYALRFDEALEFGRGVSATDEPDLWRREGDGRVSEWIEVGQPDGKRLIKASRMATQVQLFAFGRGLSRWREAQLDGLKAPDNLGVARIDDGFLEDLAQNTDRQIKWSVTQSEGTIFLTSGDKTFETTPEIWLGDPLG